MIFLPIFDQKCATKNIHGRSEEEIAAIVKEWEETPSQFAKLILGVCSLIF
jgi:hypothetical protein